MHFEDFFESEKQQFLIDQIELGDWGAAKFLAKLLREGTFQQVMGGGTVYLLMDGENIVSFVTLTRQDCIADEKLYPWLGFLYTFPAYRGHRYGGKLLEYATAQAKKRGHDQVFLATDHVGLYEKYGFSYLENRVDIYGGESRIYIKKCEVGFVCKSICGLDCAGCSFQDGCGGCAATGGKPFGGECMVAKCCAKRKDGSCGDFSKNVCQLKQKLIAEFNAFSIEAMPEVTDLYALVGGFVNLEYTLPGGQTVKFWDDKQIYLGNQLPKIGTDRCYGLMADENYLLVCEYGENAADAQIVVFKRR